MPAPRIGDPMPSIFHLLVLGGGAGGDTNVSVRVQGNTNLSIFRYQQCEVLWRWGSEPMRGPNTNGCASQWNIGITFFCWEILIACQSTPCISVDLKSTNL